VNDFFFCYLLFLFFSLALNFIQIELFACVFLLLLDLRLLDSLNREREKQHVFSVCVCISLTDDLAHLLTASLYLCIQKNKQTDILNKELS